jgi:hypothetical protein
MKSFNQFINEAKDVSTGFLKDLLKNVSDSTAKKFLNKKIDQDDNGKVHFSDRELNLLNLIKTNGKFSSKDFSSKN